MHPMLQFQTLAMLIMLVLQVVWSTSVVAIEATPHPKINITMYSVAQCPCSAQFVADIDHVLAHPSFRGATDLIQYFTPKCMDAVDTCNPRNQSDYLVCVHGVEECLGQRYFLCAQAAAANRTRSTVVGKTHSSAGRDLPGRGQWMPPTYREAPAWLDFQLCSYGQCQQCDVFTELFCLLPCKTYTTFTKPKSNDILKDCAATVGMDWGALGQCANGPEGDMLQRASAAVVNTRQETYGTRGLPVVTIMGASGASVHVTTTQKVPLFCGPTPLEVLRVLCAAYPAGSAPVECSSTAGLCGVIANATRLPECRSLFLLPPSDQA
eukprot:m.165039 g.165039  ORF g.165039 m.165039 type:complete len:323 (-) comp23975_c0_seq2:1584-2552(-)